MLEREWKKGTLPTLLMAQPLWKTVWRFLKELTVEFSYDSAILLLGMKVKILVPQLCLILCDSMDCSPQAPLFTEFSRQEY